MKFINNSFVIKSILMLAGAVLPFLSMAQVTDPGCPDCPIDGGLSLLIAAGVGYGVKKYRENKKAKAEESGSDLK